MHNVAALLVLAAAIPASNSQVPAANAGGITTPLSTLTARISKPMPHQIDAAQARQNQGWLRLLKASQLEQSRQ